MSPLYFERELKMLDTVVIHTSTIQLLLVTISKYFQPGPFINFIDVKSI